jgi:hypothetical protein
MSAEQISLLSTSWLEEAPAKTSAAPENKLASMDPKAASGTSTPALSAKRSRRSSSSKTCRRSLLKGWTELSLTSEGTVTASLVDSSKLPTSVRPTSASASSSSPSEGTWPTPRAEDSESAGAHRGVPDTLTSRVRSMESWPTPVSRDANGHKPGKNIQGGASLGHAVIQEKDWPTATATDSKSSARHGYMKTGHSGTTLLDAVREETRDWPTPTVAVAEGGQTSRGGDRASEQLLGKMAGPGKLNPDWVEALMGFPISFSDGPLDPDTLLLFGSRRER